MTHALGAGSNAQVLSATATGNAQTIEVGVPKAHSRLSHEKTYEKAAKRPRKDHEKATKRPRKGTERQ
eukprot:2018383-Pleurochrysis_carterae.AAC.1